MTVPKRIALMRVRARPVWVLSVRITLIGSCCFPGLMAPWGAYVFEGRHSVVCTGKLAATKLPRNKTEEIEERHLIV